LEEGRLIAVVMKLQLHLGYLTKEFQSQLKLQITKGQFSNGHQSHIQDITSSVVVSDAAL